MKDRTEKSMINAFGKIQEQLTNAGIYPNIHILDNEASKKFKATLVKENNAKVQLVTPHIHRRNGAERAIRTFKDDFVAGLSSADPQFPLTLWDRLLPQAIQTLNMMRSSRMNKQMSAYEQIKETYDYNSTPMVPPGSKGIVHLKPSQRYVGATRAQRILHWARNAALS